MLTYLTGSFTGTENVPLGGSITVNQSINETLVTSVSMSFIGLIIVIIAVVAIIAVVLRRKK